MNIISDDEQVYLEAVALAEKLFGTKHLKVGAALADLADFYTMHGRETEAKACELKIEQIMSDNMIPLEARKSVSSTPSSYI